MKTEELDELIKSAYNFEDGLMPMLDGIINEQEYKKSYPKILWLLWEPYDDGGWDEWDWDIRKWINANPEGFSHKTFRKIAYTSYGILNNMMFEEIENKLDVSQLLKVLRSIAYINVSKYPAEHSSNGRHPYFANVYKKCKTVLLQQIEYCKPDIIIGGNIMYLFKEDLGLKGEHASLLDFSRGVWEKDSQLFIDANHPGMRMSEKEYSNEIIDTARKWLVKKNKV